MINLKNLTPKVYYQQSRDFQFIGRLYDIVLNAAKTNTQLIENVPISNNLNSNQFLDLLSYTLGFKTLHEYNSEQLKAICGIFSLLLKYKGSITAVILATKAILNASGIKESISYNFENNNLQVSIPASLKDLSLLRDLLYYILPAGITCELVTSTPIKYEAKTYPKFKSSTNTQKFDESDLSKVISETEFVGLVQSPIGRIVNTTVVGEITEDGASITTTQEEE